MSGVVARAELSLDAGTGLSPAVVSDGSRSVLFKFATSDGEVQAGAAIEIDGSPLEPGQSGTVTLRFWADAATPFVVPGAEFVAWHSRDIGRGRILSLI
jgi:hypothetical protein